MPFHRSILGSVLLLAGPIFRLTLGNKDVVVLNRGAKADELLSKRSAIYSSRPESIFAGKYESQGRRLVLLPYGAGLKRQRAAFHQMLQTRAVGAYEHYQDAGSLKLLYELWTRPDDVFLNVHCFAASLVFRLTYGRAPEEGDKDLKEVVEVNDNFVLQVPTGAHLVDALPILDWLPDWMSPWRAKALRMHEREMKLYQRLAGEVKGRLDAEDSECFAARLWEQQQKLELDDMSVAYLGGTAFEAGTGTTSDSILWFLAAVLLNPASIKPAQAELDIVVGDHLPTFGDFEALSYCTCMTKELLRWAPVVPGGIAHVLEKDDDFEGYSLKKDTILLPNIWGMHHDEELFPNAEKFDPTRFMRTDPQSLKTFDTLSEGGGGGCGHWAFGFGRRICPGRHLAAKSVWLAITRIAWAFDILPVLDTQGNPILPDRGKCTSGLSVTPERFPVKLVPRSPARVDTVRRLYEDTC
ncbi:Fumitremorgin C synthase [Grifola frondosa]|uniref:Fumitremorgin C synthase n=1 Tax=Grifola frondosa TaxID=5627 RepID=A0A1C7LV42_GRIFR|nr:Fumitremorgin C synthase [Grifola frondosa]